jgi:hypothetical protein
MIVPGKIFYIPPLPDSRPNPAPGRCKHHKNFPLSRSFKAHRPEKKRQAAPQRELKKNRLIYLVKFSIFDNQNNFSAWNEKKENSIRKKERAHRSRHSCISGNRHWARISVC